MLSNLDSSKWPEDFSIQELHHATNAPEPHTSEPQQQDIFTSEPAQETSFCSYIFDSVTGFFSSIFSFLCCCFSTSDDTPSASQDQVQDSQDSTPSASQDQVQDSQDSTPPASQDQVQDSQDSTPPASQDQVQDSQDSTPPASQDIESENQRQNEIRILIREIMDMSFEEQTARVNEYRNEVRPFSIQAESPFHGRWNSLSRARQGFINKNADAEMRRECLKEFLVQYFEISRNS